MCQTELWIRWTHQTSNLPEESSLLGLFLNQRWRNLRELIRFGSSRLAKPQSWTPPHSELRFVLRLKVEDSC